MKTPRYAFPLRATLIGLGVAAFAYVAVFAIEVAMVLRPVATELRMRTTELLVDHDAIASSLRSMRGTRESIADAVATPEAMALVARSPELRVMQLSIRAALDTSVSMRTTVENATLPSEMRLLLAQAVEQETSTGVALFEALRSIELGNRASATTELRRSTLHGDSTEVLLAAAQRVALLDVLSREEDLLGNLRRLDRWSLLWAAAGALFLVLASWVVHRRLYGPVSQMEHAVRRIAAGDLQAEVDVTRLDEIGRLGAHLNAMTAILRERAIQETQRRENLTERFGRILDEASNEICVFDGETLLAVQANRGARVNLGYGRSELEQLALPTLLRTLGRPALNAHLDRLRRGEQPRLFLQTVQTRKDGTSYPVEMTIQYAPEGTGGVFVTVAEDASVRQRVRELDQRLRDFALDEQMVLSAGDLPAALEAITEMAADTLRATRCTIWRRLRDATQSLDEFDTRDRTHRKGETLVPGLSAVAASVLTNGDSTETHVAGQVRLEAPVRVGGRHVADVTFEHDDGPRTWSSEEQAFAEAVAELVAHAFEAADRRALEQELARAQRMESIGQLAGGVAHDFNNILTAILGNLEFCRSDVTPGDPLDMSLAEAEQAAMRAAELTRQLLTFARHQVVETRIIDLNAATRDADRMLRRLIGATIEMRSVLEPDLRSVRIAPGQFEQVIVNLVVNARDAMPNGGRIVVETRNVSLDETYAAQHRDVTPGQYVELSVSDTGAGMERETLERVFEPFYTTKPLGKGTGLGLAVCYGIVRQAGGSISVYSEVGRGSRFRIYLPAIEAEAEPVSGPARTRATGGDETILVAEDERAIRELLVRALSARGYTVVAAADGEELLGIASAHLGRIDLLLSDVVMPRLGGPDAARKLRERLPTLPVLFMSGYTSEALADSVGLTDAEFISKPFVPDDLCRRVRQLLDRRADGVAPTN